MLLTDFARLYAYAKSQGNEEAAIKIKSVLLWLLGIDYLTKGG